MKNCIFLTNIPAPYRVFLYNQLRKNFDFEVWYMRSEVKSRPNWFFDKKYLYVKNYKLINKNSNTYLAFKKSMILYPISLGVLFFTLRGDLLSATSFAVGLLASFYLSSFIVSKKLI